MISPNQFKNGTHIEIDGRLFTVVEFPHVKPGKGGAFVRSKLRRIDDGAVIDKTCKAGEKFRPVRTENKKMQYLYDSGDAVVLMDNTSYEQVEIPKDVAEDALKWVPPNSDVELLLVDERPSDLQVPTAVELEVTQTDPGLKGDTASGGGNKPATLETGTVVQVPLFIEEGEKVRVDTRSGEYVSRA
ncbi:elongation factor P [soil metagenome]